ncbi:hypothetical protein PYW08_008643 [Mythimna loreyi]|uniref:Uncharacterized protein n=1 Tax=Mythimna loreyi TaxID=667449 RepID=A0ACC2QA84_9NEOP|nr:hypothetical protein PYW08_008643 [Mythimna loreyi]
MLSILFMVFAAMTTAPEGVVVNSDYWDAASYDFKFDWILTKRVAASSDRNFLLTPLGLQLALALLTEAATGDTQTELTSVLGFDLDRKLVRKKFANIIESLQEESPDYNLRLGSSIYVSDDAQVRPRFVAVAKEFYKCELKNVNFHNPAVASKEINGWVSNITQENISSVDEDDVANMVMLVLNSLYIRGIWSNQFLRTATKLGTFYVSPTVQKTVPFMTVKDKFYYIESSKYDAKILKMPYRGEKYAMYIIVPNSLTGLPRVLNDLSDLSFTRYLREYQVDVTLPKFKFDYTLQLDGVLRELGIRSAFDVTASFPGIARGQLLDQRPMVSKVLQRSSIEVNELGSVTNSPTWLLPENKTGEDTEATAEVVANRPFLFFIQDEATRQLLFTGRVADPSLADGAFKL